MQTDNIQQTNTLPRENELADTRDRAKLEPREGEEEQTTSQTSTLQSLGDVGEQTPKSAEVPQKTFHKVTDAIASGVEGIKNLVLVDQTKLQQEASNIQGEIKQKAEEIKGKVTEKFGDEVQPQKDLDSEVKEQIKEVNEEIRQQPHGEEEVFEGQGQGKAQSGKQEDADFKDKDLRFASGETLEKALEKIDEMIHQPKENSGQESHEHHHLTTESRSFKPTEETHQLIEAVKEGLEEHVPLTEKIQEFEEHRHEGSQQEQENAAETVKQGAQGLGDKISDKVQDVKEGLEQKKEEIIEKVQAQERKPIVDQVFDRIHAVNESLHQSVENVKNAFKVEERSGDQKPLVDVVTEKIIDVKTTITHGIESVNEGIHNITHKIGQNVENIKNKITHQKE